MLNFKKKTFADSFLYAQESNKHDKNLVDFIIKSDRIDKHSDAFRGIIEDVKRQQTSSILYTVLTMDNVILCINSTELPRAFKVFEAKDLRIGKNAGKAVFIDVTGLITLKDGYFTCKKIDILITYLFGALAYLLYQEAPLKIVNNSNISISGTECFVSLFNYIIDYLRIIGFAQNKNKISYLAGLYFLYNMMGKDIDTYTKNIAAKAAGISTTDTKAFELYYNLEDFDNIFTFITMISETFKLKGLTPEVFINKWMYLFGTGTQYAVELFTSFSVLMTNAYCGSYVVNQKQIERCCGASMVKYATSLLKVGTDVFDNRGYMEASELDSLDYKDKNTIALAESILKKIPESAKFNKKDYISKDRAKSKTKSLIDYYISINKEDKISKKIWEAANSIMFYIMKENYEDGTLDIVLKESKKYIKDAEKRLINSAIDQSIRVAEDEMKEYRMKNNKEKASFYAKKITELRKCKSYV